MFDWKLTVGQINGKSTGFLKVSNFSQFLCDAQRSRPRDFIQTPNVMVSDHIPNKTQPYQHATKVWINYHIKPFFLKITLEMSPKGFLMV